MDHAIISTPFGNLKLSAENDALFSCLWTTDTICIDANTPILKEAQSQLNAYFQQKLQTFDLSLAPRGTVFQQTVWRTLQKIPYGKTCSYQDIAIAIEKPSAMRAVGMANGKNPLCVIIPCHRVIYASQKIGGYSGGIHYKEQLLALENSDRNTR